MNAIALNLRKFAEELSSGRQCQYAHLEAMLMGAMEINRLEKRIATLLAELSHYTAFPEAAPENQAQGDYVDVEPYLVGSNPDRSVKT